MDDIDRRIGELQSEAARLEREKRKARSKAAAEKLPAEPKIMGEEVEELVKRLRERAYAIAAVSPVMADDTLRNTQIMVAAANELESLRASLTRVEEERDEAVRALEPFAKARPTETGFDPADGDALFSTRHHNPIGLHEWVIARDLHTRLSRDTRAEGK